MQFPIIPGSEVPLLALISEGSALIVYVFLSLRVFPRWRERRARPALNLLLCFVSYVIAISFLFFTKTTNFMTGDLVDISTLGINLGYLFSALGNVFLFYFTENIFYEKRIPYLREFITLANGITLGFLAIFIFQVQTFPFIELPGFYIPPHMLIWHVLVSSLGFAILIYRALKETRLITDKLSKYSFTIIGISGVFEVLVFVFFFADRFMPEGYTIWYFLAWLSASIAGLCSMIGFLRPRWFKRLVLGAAAEEVLTP